MARIPQRPLGVAVRRFVTEKCILRRGTGIISQSKDEKMGRAKIERRPKAPKQPLARATSTLSVCSLVTWLGNGSRWHCVLKASP